MKKAKLSDLKNIINIVDQAKESLKDDGVDQWQNGSPDIMLIGRQISSGNSYIIVGDEDILAYAYLSDEYEPTYAAVMNIVKGVDAYTIHTFCVANHAKGKGVASLFFEEIIDYARENGKDSLRIDTHEDNFKMRGLIKKLGFKELGQIYIRDNGLTKARIAYELML